MDVLLITDMQAGILFGETTHDLEGVISRINRLAARVREKQGCVIFIRHEGSGDDDFVPGRPGWEFLDSLTREQHDLIVTKRLNDAFFETELQKTLDVLGTDRVLVSG